jgi:hypothetical protein
MTRDRNCIFRTPASRSLRLFPALPPLLRRSIETLKRAINTISSVETRISELEREIVQLKVTRNALTPFRRVPMDVLLTIARLTMCWSAEIATRDTFALASVCSRVRVTLVSSPRLWAKIDLRQSEAWIDRCVTHAGAHPLSLRVYIGPF